MDTQHEARIADHIEALAAENAELKATLLRVADVIVAREFGPGGSPEYVRGVCETTRAIRAVLRSLTDDQALPDSD